MNIAKLILVFLLTATSLGGMSQTIVSAGVFTGFTIPLTLDQGITKDPRYQIRYDVKWAPIGANLGIDFENFSLLTNPSLMRIGQNFYLANTVGGQVGRRRIDLTYLQVPAGVKIHLIRMSFFRISLVASVGASYLFTGKETITHETSKMWFPEEVKPKLPSEYVLDYDGVVVPTLIDMEITTRTDYKPIQLFAAAGLRSDWDVADHIRLSMDLRLNANASDPRTNEYKNKVIDYDAYYDLPGRRSDLYLTFNIGISRIIELDKKSTAQPIIKFKGQYRNKKARHKRN